MNTSMMPCVQFSLMIVISKCSLRELKLFPVDINVTSTVEYCQVVTTAQLSLYFVVFFSVLLCSFFCKLLIQEPDENEQSPRCQLIGGDKLIKS